MRKGIMTLVTVCLLIVVGALFVQAAALGNGLNFVVSNEDMTVEQSIADVAGDMTVSPEGVLSDDPPKNDNHDGDICTDMVAVCTEHANVVVNQCFAALQQFYNACMQVEGLTADDCAKATADGVDVCIQAQTTAFNNCMTRAGCGSN